MYVIYRRKGFQDYPVQMFGEEINARKALERFQLYGQHFLRQEDDNSYAVQTLLKNQSERECNG